MKNFAKLLITNLAIISPIYSSAGPEAPVFPPGTVEIQAEGTALRPFDLANYKDALTHIETQRTESIKNQVKQSLNTNKSVIPSDGTGPVSVEDYIDNQVARGAIQVISEAGVSIGGGGMRGYYPALMLQQCEKVTNRATYQFCKRIDGTSIGGILGLGLATPTANGQPHAASEYVKIFEVNGVDIFHKPTRARYNVIGKIIGKMWDGIHSLTHHRYSSAGLERVVKTHLGEATTMEQLLRPTLVTAVDSNTQQPVFIRSDSDLFKSCLVWKAACATSAAPTFFEACQFGPYASLQDGGLFCNNPVDILYRDLGGMPRNSIILSLGTGIVPPAYRIPDDAGYATALLPALETVMNADAFGREQAMREIYVNHPVNYKSFNPELTFAMDLDDTDPDKLARLKAVAESSYEELANFVQNGPLRRVLERSDAPAAAAASGCSVS